MLGIRVWGIDRSIACFERHQRSVDMSAEPYLRTVWTDPVSGRRGYVVIDRLVRGIAGGGTRVRRGVTLEEVERLARTMTLKNGALSVPSGGAKAGLDCDITEPGGHQMLVRFLSAVKPLLQTRWATAEDLGITQEELDQAFQEIGLGVSVYAGLSVGGDRDAAMDRVVRGLNVKVGGIALPDLIGGFGVAEAAVAALRKVGIDPQGARAVIQGFGSMGGGTGRYLVEHGIRVVGVVDVHGCVVDSNGLDVESLLAHRSPLGDIDRATLPASASERARDEWLDIDCEVLVPAALGDVLTEANADKVRARVVIEAANLPTTDGAERRLHDRGVIVIPDFVANSGANGWWWMVMLGLIEPTEKAAYEYVRQTLHDTVERLLTLSEQQRVTPREAAVRIATENTERLAEQYGTEEARTPAASTP
jgi:glutamate dehydrogenase (NAD(P)+)